MRELLARRDISQTPSRRPSFLTTGNSSNKAGIDEVSEPSTTESSMKSIMELNNSIGSPREKKLGDLCRRSIGTDLEKASRSRTTLVPAIRNVNSKSGAETSIMLESPKKADSAKICQVLPSIAIPPSSSRKKNLLAAMSCNAETRITKSIENRARPTSTRNSSGLFSFDDFKEFEEVDEGVQNVSFLKSIKAFNLQKKAKAINDNGPGYL
jgi:hypothetical protein